MNLIYERERVYLFLKQLNSLARDNMEYHKTFLVILALKIAVIVFGFYQTLAYRFSGSFEIQASIIYIIIILYLLLFLMAIVLIVIYFIKGSFGGVAYFSVLILDALAGLQQSLSFRCFVLQNWCQDNSLLKVGNVFLIVLGFLLVTLIRCHLIVPLFEPQNILSVKSFTNCIVDSLFMLALQFIGTYGQLIQGYWTDSLLAGLSLAFFITTDSKNYYNQTMIRISATINQMIIFTGLLNIMLVVMSVITDSPYWSKSFPLIWVICSLPVAIFTYLSYNTNVYSQNSLIIKNQEPFHILYAINFFRDKVCKLYERNHVPSDQEISLFKDFLIAHLHLCKSQVCPLKKLLGELESSKYSISEEKTRQRQMEYCFQKMQDLVSVIQQSSQSNFYIESICLGYSYQYLRNRGLLRQILTLQRFELSHFQKLQFVHLRTMIEFQKNQRQSFLQNQVAEVNDFLQKTIEDNVIKLNQFWRILANAKCNQDRLYTISSQIFMTRKQIHLIWQRIAVYRFAASYRLYALYLREVLGDKQESRLMMLQAEKIQNQIKSRRFVDKKIGINQDQEQRGKIYLSLDTNDYGYMTTVTLPVEVLFGYKAGQLSNRRVNDLMPIVFSNYHDRILLNYQKTGDSYLINRDRTMVGKRSTGFIFEFEILIKVVVNALRDQTEIVALLNRHYYYKETIIFITDQQGCLMDISASAVALFNVDLTTLKFKVSIEEYLPRVIKNRHEFNEGKEMVLRQRLEGLILKREYKVIVQNISLGIANLIGYKIKMTRSNILEVIDSQPEITPPRFFFVPRMEHDFVIKSSLNPKLDCKIVRPFIEYSRASNLQNRDRVNYGLNIRNQRFFQNKLIDLQSDKSMSEGEGAKVQDIQKIEKVISSKGKSFRISQLINKFSEIRRLNFIIAAELATVLIALIVLIISLVALFYQKQYIEKDKTMTNQVWLLSEIMSDLQYLNLFYLSLLNNHRTVKPFSSPDQQRTRVERLQNLSSIITNYESLTFYQQVDGKIISANYSVQELTNKFIVPFQKIISGRSPLQISYQLFNNSLITLPSEFNKSLWRTINISKVINSQFESKISSLLWIQVPLQMIHLVAMIAIFYLIFQKKRQVLKIFFQIPRSYCNDMQHRGLIFLAKKSHNFNQNQVSIFTPQQKQSKNNKKRVIQQDMLLNYLPILIMFLFHILLLLFLIIILAVFRGKQSQLFSISPLMVESCQLQSLLVNTQALHSCVIQSCPQSPISAALMQLTFNSRFSQIQGQMIFIQQEYLSKLSIISGETIKVINQIYFSYNSSRAFQGLSVCLQLFRTLHVQRSDAPALALLYDTIRLKLRSTTSALLSQITNKLVQNELTLIVLVILFALFVGGVTTSMISMKLREEEYQIHATESMLVFVPAEQVVRNSFIDQYIRNQVLVK